MGACLPLETYSLIPVTVIGGYLGCGKTTLVNHLLRTCDGMRLAILVNDFGELPIDADLIESEDGDVISLTGGCVCCSYGNDLSMALIDVCAMQSPPDHIVIEASGVALPGAIAASVSIIQGLSMEGIVVLADASTVQSHAADTYLSDTISRQLTQSDLIVLNKIDLVSEENHGLILKWLSANYPEVRVVSVSHALVPARVLLGGFQRVNDKQHDPSLHDSTLFESTQLTFINALDARVLAEALAGPQCGLVRAKGFVKDLDGCLKTLQVVGRRWSVTDAPSGVSPGLVCIGMATEFSAERLHQQIDGIGALNRALPSETGAA